MARTHQELNLRHQDFRNSRRRDFDALLPTTSCFRHPASLQRTPVRGTLRSSRASGRKVVQPRKGIWVRRTIRWSGDAFLHGSVLAQRSIDAVQPGDTLEVRVGPGHKGPHITEVLSADTSTATPTTSPRSSFRAATSTGESTSLRGYCLSTTAQCSKKD